ncbi:MAG: prenyltransferase/squalene oxidase repeat-containing protein, partial [Candidatus Saccharimonadales bacterium]
MADAIANSSTDLPRAPAGSARSLGRRAMLFSAAAAAIGRTRLLAAAPRDDQSDVSAAPLITPAAQQAIDLGLRFLAERQQDDGAFGSGGYRRNTAVCSLAAMAWMAGGSTPDRGPYGRNVNQSLDFVLSGAQDSGLIDVPGYSGNGAMYGHGFATLFLAENYGMARQFALRGTLSQAVRLIVSTQNAEGGWRYAPRRDDADISVTVCQMMALRAARNAGIFVPKQTIDRAVEFVERSQNTDGGFRYTLAGGESGFARSAAAVTALY